MYGSRKWRGHFIRNGLFVESGAAVSYFGTMAQVHVSLPQDLSDWAELRAAQGGYDDPADYVRDVVRREREYQEKLARLQAAIDEGRRSPISDRTIEDIIADGL